LVEVGLGITIGPKRSLSGQTLADLAIDQKDHYLMIGMKILIYSLECVKTKEPRQIQIAYESAGRLVAPNCKRKLKMLSADNFNENLS